MSKAKRIVLALIATGTLVGCPNPNLRQDLLMPEASEDTVPVILAAMEAAAAVADVAAVSGIGSSDQTACITYKSLSTAIRSAADGLTGGIIAPRLPKIDIDVSECMPEGVASAEDKQAAALSSMIVDLTLSSAIGMAKAYRTRLSCAQARWVEAGFNYTRGVSAAVIAEVKECDRVVSIPAVDVDLSGCE